MEVYEQLKNRFLDTAVEVLTQLALHNINILRMTPSPVCEEHYEDGYVVDFEYLYRTPAGQTKWHKASVYWGSTSSSTDALHYVLDVATELQKRLEQGEGC